MDAISAAQMEALYRAAVGSLMRRSCLGIGPHFSCRSIGFSIDECTRIGQFTAY
jgi:hypothetical protein